MHLEFMYGNVWVKNHPKNYPAIPGCWYLSLILEPQQNANFPTPVLILHAQDK